MTHSGQCSVFPQSVTFGLYRGMALGGKEFRTWLKTEGQHRPTGE